MKKKISDDRDPYVEIVEHGEFCTEGYLKAVMKAFLKSKPGVESIRVSIDYTILHNPKNYEFSIGEDGELTEWM